VTRILGLTVLTSAFLAAFLAAQDGPAPAKKEGQPPAKQDGNKGDAAPAKGDAKDVKGDAKGAEEKAPEESREDIVKRIQENLEGTVEKLAKDKDPGMPTQDKQQKVIDDLEKLIKQQSDSDKDCNCKNPQGGGGMGQAQNPMSKPMGGMDQQPMNADGNPMSKPMGGMDQQPMNAQGKPMPQKGDPKGNGQPMQKDDVAKGNKGEKGEKDEKNDEKLSKGKKEDKGEADKPGMENKDVLAKLKEEEKKNGGKKPGAGDSDAKGKLVDPKDFSGAWGQLPMKDRQKLDVHANERIMPRYQRLIEQYYSTIARENRRKEGE